MKHWQIPLITFAALFVSLALAEDFKTTNGKEYKNATVTLVEPDGITLRSKSGVSKVYFNKLPKEVQECFHYDPQKAAAASAEQAVSIQQANQQVEESNKQRKEAEQQKVLAEFRRIRGQKASQTELMTDVFSPSEVTKQKLDPGVMP